MPKQPNPLQFLELRRQTWHFVKDIPLPLRGFFRTPDGQQTKRIVRSLGTHDLDEAKRRRAAALADYEAKMAVVRLEHAPAVRLQQSATWHQQMHQRALRHRETISRLVAGDTAGVTVDPAAPVTATTEAERALSVSDWIIDDEAENIQEEHGKAAAEEFLQIVRNPETLIQPLIEMFLKEEDIEPRSAGDHRRALNELIKWTKAEGRKATVETFSKRVAGQYVSHLLSGGMDRAKTVSKRLWSLSAFWRYLDRKGHVESGVNPWKGHAIGGGRSARDKTPERPFTPAELHKLFEGNPDLELRDLMQLAFHSGARLEELALLRVKDINIADKTMSIFADPKTASSRRIVPVHPEIWPTVEARIKDKVPDTFLIEELGPAPRPGRQRSMAVSKAFGRYRVKVGVDDMVAGQRRSLVNFHSFRRTFVTLAEQAAIPESTIRSVVGHKRAGMTFGTYSGGPSLEQRRTCVESIRLPPKP